MLPFGHPFRLAHDVLFNRDSRFNFGTKHALVFTEEKSKQMKSDLITRSFTLRNTGSELTVSETPTGTHVVITLRTANTTNAMELTVPQWKELCDLKYTLETNE